MDATPKLADVILELCKTVAPPETIDPVDAAKAFAQVSGRGRSAPWEGYLQPVRDNAVRLAREGKIIIYRKGVPADPDTFKGPYRLGLATNA
ncbi:DUF3253 domain-containing protein [Methylocapsa aurea]|uniref:DUF3253 domain-containing protein n=1 Tax=Methylocapsa aurea TaxID=663610 RepID=UPI000560D426|nr:DUF3253 domain-containing protein [Methylocapsa aurea]